MRLDKTNDEKQEKPPVAGFGCSSLCFYSISILFIYLSMLVHHSSNPVTDLPLLDRLDLFVAKIITPLTETRNRTPGYIADFGLSFHWRTSYLPRVEGTLTFLASRAPELSQAISTVLHGLGSFHYLNMVLIKTFQKGQR